MIDRLFAVAVGIWLAALQISLFLSLELLLSSAFLTFVVLVLSWVLGGALGVWIPRGRWSLPLMFLAGAAPYASFAVLAVAPYNTALIWVHGMLITITALYAGHFFQQERLSFRRIGDLFFWENNGFVLGLGIVVLGFVFYGRPLLYAVPLGGLLAISTIWLMRTSMRKAATDRG